MEDEVKRIKAEWEEAKSKASTTTSDDTVAINSMVGDNADANNGSNSVDHGGARV